MHVLSVDDYVMLRQDLPQFNLHAGDVGMVREPYVPLLRAVEVEFLPPDAQASICVPVQAEQLDWVPRISLEPESSDLFSSLSSGASRNPTRFI